MTIAFDYVKDILQQSFSYWKRNEVILELIHEIITTQAGPLSATTMKMQEEVSHMNEMLTQRFHLSLATNATMSTQWKVSTLDIFTHY